MGKAVIYVKHSDLVKTEMAKAPLKPVQDAVGSAVSGVVEVVFDIGSSISGLYSFLVAYWKVLIVGAVALVLLLRR